MDYTKYISLSGKTDASGDRMIEGSVKARLLKAFLPISLIIIVTNALFFTLLLTYYHFRLPYLLLFSASTLLIAAVINFFIVMEITRSVGGMLDTAIQEKNKVQARLLSQKLFYENILNKIPVDITVYDHEFKYLYCNPSTIKDEEERKWIVGKSDMDYCLLKKLDTKIAIERQSLFNKAVSNKFAISVEQQYEDEKGEMKFTLRTMTPGMDTSEENETYISFGFDITSLKIQEEALRNKNSELEKTNFELDKFVYSASHDLKAPLSSVLGLINLSKRETEEPALINYLMMMEKSIFKLDKFIKDLIHFSRNTRLEVQALPVNFDTIISERVDDLRYMEFAEKVRLERNISANPFVSDESRISTIFNNLISNSVKYYNTKAADSYIRINIDTDLEKAVIVVEDNGMGIEEAHQDKIFDMFYRATEHSQGSGLGLYIVKEMVRKLSGTIQVESKPMQGTRFTITLPNLIAQLEEEPQTKKTPELQS